MTTAQLQSSKQDRTNQKHDVFHVIANHPGLTNKQIAEHLGIAPGSCSARIKELLTDGWVKRTDAKGGAQLYPVHNENERRATADQFAKEEKRRHLDAMRKHANELRQFMTVSEKAALRSTVERLKTAI